MFLYKQEIGIGPKELLETLTQGSYLEDILFFLYLLIKFT